MRKPGLEIEPVDFERDIRDLLLDRIGVRFHIEKPIAAGDAELDCAHLPMSEHTGEPCGLVHAVAVVRPFNLTGTDTLDVWSRRVGKVSSLQPLVDVIPDRMGIAQEALQQAVGHLTSGPACAAPSDTRRASTPLLE